MTINEDEIEAAGLNVRQVHALARRLEKVALDASKLGICIFGGSSGELRYDQHNGLGELKLASVRGDFDGGDGADHDWGDGLLRGE